MPLNQEKLSAALADLEQIASKGKFKSLAGMFTKRAMADLGLVVLAKDGTHRWNKENEYGIESYEEFLNLPAEEQRKFAKSYIEVAEKQFHNIVKKNHISYDDITTDKEILYESLFTKGARGTAIEYKVKKESFKQVNDSKTNLEELTASNRFVNNPKLIDEVAEARNNSGNISTTILEVRTAPLPKINLTPVDLSRKIDPASARATIENSTIRTTNLEVVTVRAERYIVPGSGKTTEELYSKTSKDFYEMLKKSGRSVSVEEQLKFVKDSFKKQGVNKGISYSIDETDRIHFKGKIVQENYGIYSTLLKGLNFKIESSVEKNDSLFVDHDSGKISDEQQLYLAFIAKNKGRAPVFEEDNKSSVISGGFIKGENNYSIQFKLKPEEVDALLPDMPQKNRDALKNKDISLEYKPSFKPEKYEKFLKTNAESLNEGISYEFLDRSVNVTDHQELFDKLLPTSEHQRDFNTVNTLASFYPNTSIADYKLRYYNMIARERETYHSWNSVTHPSATKTDEEKAADRQHFDDVKKQVKQNSEFYNEAAKLLDKFDYKGNDPEIKHAIKILKLTAENDVLLAKFDEKILSAKDYDDVIKAAAKYDKAKNRNDVLLLNLSSFESKNGMDKLKQLAGLPWQVKQLISEHEEDFSKKPWQKEGEHPTREQENDAVINHVIANNLATNNAPKAGISSTKPLALDFTYKTLTNFNKDGTSNKTSISNLGFEGGYTGYIVKDRLYGQANGNLNIGLLKNEQSNEFYKPLQKNNSDYFNRQNLNAEIGFIESPFHKTTLNARFETNAAVKSAEYSVKQDFLNVSGVKKSLSLNLPSNYNYANGQIKTNYGIGAGVSGTILMTGDKLNYSFSTNAASANYSSAATSTENKLFLTNSASATYINNSFNARISAESRTFVPFQENGFSNLTTSVSASKSFGEFSLKVNNTNFNSANFTINDSRISFDKPSSKLGFEASAGLTNLKLKLPGLNEEQLSNILNVGAKLQINSKNKLLDDTEINLNFSKTLKANGNILPQPGVQLGIKHKLP